jgi:MFS family permease
MRKFFGIVFISFGCLLALCILSEFFEAIFKAINLYSIGSFNIGYLVGQLIFYFLCSYLSYRLVKQGIQLTKKKKVEIGDIEKIMSIK